MATSVLLSCGQLKVVFNFSESRGLMTLDTDEVARTLARRGLRLTRQRRAVLDAVAAASSGISPLQVFDAAREHCPDLGLTTVYRTLEVLSEIGALRRVHGPDHCEAFVPAGSDHGHTVVCSRCGRVTEFTDCDMHAVVAAAAVQTGYRITEHFLQLSGICHECGSRTGERPALPGDKR
jgi:Fur family transcriptional regulator, ferric uptake regulator